MDKQSRPSSGPSPTGFPSADGRHGGDCGGDPSLPLFGLSRDPHQPPHPKDAGAPTARGDAPSLAEATFQIAQNRDLSSEVERLRNERDRLREERNRLTDTQHRIMELIGAQDPAKILHDLRNVLNERELYRALADFEAPA